MAPGRGRALDVEEEVSSDEERAEEMELLRIKETKELREREAQERKLNSQKLSSQNIVHFDIDEERDLRILEAVRSGSNESVHSLVEEGADIDNFDNNGTTPLHVAAAQDESIMRFLCWNGAYVRCEDVWRRTPLHYVCISGYTTRPLVQGGALLTNYDVNGYMPMHYAAIHGHVSCIQELLEKQPNVIALCLGGKTILHHAVRNGHLDCVKAILSKKDIGLLLWTDIDKRNPLHDAIEVNNMDMLKYLIKRGFQLGIGDRWHNVPMHTAAIWGRLRILKYLILEEHASLSDADVNGWNVLHWACAAGTGEEGYPEIVKFLLSRAANVNCHTTDQLTPLMIAIKNNRNNIVEHLIKEAKADIELKNSRGETALQIAASCGNDEAAAYLYKIVGIRMSIVKGNSAILTMGDKKDRSLHHTRRKSSIGSIGSLHY